MPLHCIWKVKGNEEWILLTVVGIRSPKDSKPLENCRQTNRDVCWAVRQDLALQEPKSSSKLKIITNTIIWNSYVTLHPIVASKELQHSGIHSFSLGFPDPTGSTLRKLLATNVLLANVWRQLSPALGTDWMTVICGMEWRCPKYLVGTQNPEVEPHDHLSCHLKYGYNFCAMSV